MERREIHKVLIANRGEIAVRIMRTCKEMGISTVAVYSDADRTMPHVYTADEAYHIGPSVSRESYLHMDRILEAAKKSHADAIHPGYGFLSENAVFAQRVANEGLIFIGPRPESIRSMGNKTAARKLALESGIPIVPGSEAALPSEEEARAVCAKLGYPVLIKASAGGGGKGMRIVWSESELPAGLSGAKAEALSAFGNHDVYVEKYIENPRHIEFQIIADQYGNTVHLGERECSIQRRHQKVVEESPSTFVDETLRGKMGETAVNVAKACGYQNAGTVEFLVDKDRNYYFLEMNTRLQVEHPVTEMRTGIDLVAQQLRIAMGEQLTFTQDDIEFRGHAIECRIYAEDGAHDFLPSTGKISHLKPSEGFGIRDDRGVDAGGDISLYYDPMISKLVAWGKTRNETIERMKRALRDYEIFGVTTNIPVNLFIMEHPKFIEGDFDTNFFTDHFKPNLLPVANESQLQAAAIVCCLLRHHNGNSQARMSFNGSPGRSRKANDQPDSLKTKYRLGNWKGQRIENLRA